MLHLRLLGPVQLSHGQAVVDLGVKKSLALLVLLECRGRLSRTEVTGLLWPELDESSARRNLRRELARLRDAGAPGAVLTDGDWLLPGPDLRSDAAAMREALDLGQADEALALWRGPLAQGLALDDAPAFDDWVAGEREIVRALRTRALVASAGALEAAGQTEAALARVQTLLQDDALQEQFHRDAMRLHAACGRREAALAQYERCCELLKTELDLLPMQETRALAEALRGSATMSLNESIASVPSRATGVAALRDVLPDALPFVGRDAEVQWLESAWRGGHCLLIEGEGGVGKSRLVADFIAAHGPYALVRCRPGDAEVPYAAFTRALRVLIGPSGPSPELGELPAWVVVEMARLLPELGPAPAPLRSEAERARFVEACSQGWLALATENFDAIVLDDWHCADAASRALLAFIAERRHDGGKAGAREVLVYRPELSEAATEALRQLRASVDARHLLLTPLPPAAVLDLVRRLSGAEAPQLFAARLGQATLGNPFFLHETLRHLMERGLLAVGSDGVWSTPFDQATQDYRELEVPASLREAVLARVQRLPTASQRVLEAAALAVEPFAPALLAPACALSELDTVLAIEQALAARLLREHEAGGFAFAHDLVQQAIDAALSPERRRLVHRRLALGAEQSGAGPALIAAHHEASGDPARAVAQRIAAGDQAQRLHAQTEAAAQWRQALADGPTPAQSVDLHLRLMRTERMRALQGERDPHSTALLGLIEAGHVSEAQRSDVLIAVANHFVRNGLRREALDLLDSLPATISEHQQAQAMDTRAEALRRMGQLDAALAAARAALALPAMQGQDRADLLFTLALAEHAAGRLASAMPLAEEALALCQTLGDEGGVGRGLCMRGTFLIEMGDADGAQQALKAAVAHCTRMGFVVMRRASLYSLSASYLEQTQLGEALEVAQEGWQLQPALAQGELRLMYRTAFVGAQMGLGDLGSAWAHALPAAQEALRIAEPYPIAGVALATLELFGLLGAHELAAPLLAGVDDSTLASLPHVAKEAWLARAQFELMAGDRAAAAHSLERVAAGGAIVDPRVRERHLLMQAELALAQGDAAAALALLPDPEAPSANPECRLRRLALRAQAQAQRGMLDATTVALARAALAAPQVHAVAALYLLRALPGAGVLLAAHIERLGNSLAAEPERQRAFGQRWSPAD